MLEPRCLQEPFAVANVVKIIQLAAAPCRSRTTLPAGAQLCSSRLPTLRQPPQAQRLRRQSHTCSCSAAASSPPQAGPALEAGRAADMLVRWLIERKGLPPQRADIVQDDEGACSLVANQDTSAGQALLDLPGDISVTGVDVAAHPDVAPLAAGRGELTGLALWLMAEQAKGPASEWAPLLATLPRRTLTPVLWPDGLRAELLRGSPVLAEARQRQKALEREWGSIAEGIAAAEPGRYSQEVYNLEAFGDAMSVALAHAAFLPAAACFALLPLVSLGARTGDEAAGAVLDYDLSRERVTLTAARDVGRGEAVAVYDGRPNGELVLATGALEDRNPADCQIVQTGLVQADRLYTAKKQLVEAMGLETVQAFPVFRDRMPVQLLAYLRLARLTDTAQLAKVSLTEDVVLSQLNEYEVLQLLLGECRDRLSAYSGTAEEDLKILQQRNLSPEQRLAARLRAAEKAVLQSTLDAVRRRLAPIRGIPTKGGGMTNPNADLQEVFDSIEALPSLPSKLVGGLMSWARGEQDPDWKKKGGAKQRQPPKP